MLLSLLTIDEFSVRDMKKLFNKLHPGALPLILVVFAGVELKLEKVDPTFSSFNPCPSVPSVTTDDREQFQ